MTIITLGIDIAKASFDAALLQDEQYEVRHFSNDLDGYRKLHKWLKKRQARSCHVCLEATGRYGEGVANFLHEQGYTVSVINPARLKAYAASKLQRVKTDRQDARLLADFCATQKPDQWSPPAAELIELQALTRHLQALQEDRQRARNRLHAANPSDRVNQAIAEQIAFLDAQIAELEKQIQQHIDQNPNLRQQHDLLTSIPGIGDKSAAVILAEMPDPQQFPQAGQMAAYAGLTPRIRQSGTSVSGRSKLSKTGNARLRTALFMPALVALRYNPRIQALAERLTERGKSKMTIVGAAMRKMLHLAYGVLKTGKPFDPDYLVNVQVTS